MAETVRLRARAAGLLATWFGAGLLPGAPGTWGSLAALPPAWLLLVAGGWPALLGGAVLVTAAGIWAAGDHARRLGEGDPGQIVVDEVAGQWLALVPAGLDPWLFAAGFLAFRALDIAKPWPAGWADRRVGGGWGIMLDDLIAGAYAAGLVWLAAELFRW